MEAPGGQSSCRPGGQPRGQAWRLGCQGHGAQVGQLPPADHPVSPLEGAQPPPSALGSGKILAVPLGVHNPVEDLFWARA